MKNLKDLKILTLHIIVILTYIELSKILSFFYCNKTRYCDYIHRVKIAGLKKRHVTLYIHVHT